MCLDEFRCEFCKQTCIDFVHTTEKKCLHMCVCEKALIIEDTPHFTCLGKRCDGLFFVLEATFSECIGVKLRVLEGALYQIGNQSLRMLNDASVWEAV